MGDLKEPEPSGQERLDRHLVGGVENGGRHSAIVHGLARQPEGPEPALVRPLEAQGPELDQIEALGGRGHAAGQARPTAMGVRMSGLASCASIEPSR